jgi:hypothetical protein
LDTRWKKLYEIRKDEDNEELHNLYSSPSIIRMVKSMTMRWAAHVALKREKNIACRLLAGKPERKRPLGRRRHRWMDTIKMDLG